MPRKAKQTRQSRVKANHAVVISEDQERALRQIAFGNEWDTFEAGIEERISDYQPIDSVKQSTRRALGMIREMMFERL